MNKKLKLILTGQTITICLYTLVYLCKTFIMFEFTNPFQWIIDIPIYTNTERGNILFYVLGYYSVLYIILYMIIYEKEITIHV